MYTMSRLIISKKVSKQANVTLANFFYNKVYQTAESKFSDDSCYWTNFIINRSLVTNGVTIRES